MFENAPIIHRYTRAQAIADGTLVDVTEHAVFGGFVIPVAMTATALGEVRAQVSAKESEEDRTLVAIMSALVAMRKAIAVSPDGDRVTFTAKGVELYAVCGPGDDAEPVVTVMLVGED